VLAGSQLAGVLAGVRAFEPVMLPHAIAMPSDDQARRALLRSLLLPRVRREVARIK